jgi:DNA-binding transcriptional regulator YiaG
MAITMNNHVFKGHRTLLGSKYVTYGEVELSTREDIYHKSQNGFDWGNGGKGSNQLAFSILCQLTNKNLAEQYAEKFTHDVVRSFNNRDWVLSASEVLSWVDKNCEKKEEEPVLVNPKIQTNLSKTVTKKSKSNVVKEICKELNITQKNLAEILEVPEGTISSWAVKNEIPRLGKKAIEFYVKSIKNQKIVDSYKNFITLLQAS